VDIVCYLFERKFAAHGLEQYLIQTIGKPEEAICDPSLTAQQGSHGCQHRIETSGRLSHYCWSSRCPHQPTARVVTHLRVRIQDGVLQIRKSGVIQRKLSLESAVGDPFVLLEPRNDLGQHLPEGHHYLLCVWRHHGTPALLPNIPEPRIELQICQKSLEITTTSHRQPHRWHR
jgi:hypothetical protein